MKTLWIVLAATLLMACGDDGDGDVTDTSTTIDVDDDDASDAAGDTGGDDVAADGSDDAEVAAPECPAPTGARPSARAEHAGVYDPEGDQMVLFGGSFGVPVNCSAIVSHTYENDTWLYDVACDQWREVAEGAVEGRVRHSAVYDSQERRMLVYGGRRRAGSSGPYTLPTEVLAFDLATETWSALPTTGYSAPRFNHAAAYDPTGHRMLVFGGNLSDSGLVYTETAEVWALDLTTNAWSQVATQGGGSPPARFWVSGTWDAGRQWLVVFGGTNAAEAFSNTADYYEDLWALDFTTTPATWYRLDTGGQPPLGRIWAGLVHDSVNDRYLVFGGHDDGNLGNRNDLWALEPLEGTWELVRIGDTYNKPPNGFCDFPPDFAVIDAAVPERRHAHVFAQGPDGVWLTGGKTDCGNADDLFRYDFAAGTWDETVPATTGESCLRQGGVGCTDMCF